MTNRIMRQGRTGFFHWCPACEMMHPLPDSWTFDGNLEKPTFQPSFEQTFVRWTGGIDPEGRGRGEKQDLICHYIITAGIIQFCNNSWHGRSDLIAMPPIPDNLADDGDGFQIETEG